MVFGLVNKSPLYPYCSAMFFLVKSPCHPFFCTSSKVGPRHRQRAHVHGGVLPLHPQLCCICQQLSNTEAAIAANHEVQVQDVLGSCHGHQQKRPSFMGFHGKFMKKGMDINNGMIWDLNTYNVGAPVSIAKLVQRTPITTNNYGL